MHYLFALIFILSIPVPAATKSKAVQEAEASIKALLSPLIPGAAHKPSKELKDFRVDKCEKHKINWMKVMLMQEKALLKFTFKDGCDIEGTIEPKVFQDFPAKLKLRHLENYDSIQSINKITAGLETKPILFLNMTSGVLSGAKAKVKFEADYQVQIDPMNSKKPVANNQGGEIRISEVNGQATNIKEKIKIK